MRALRRNDKNIVQVFTCYILIHTSIVLNSKQILKNTAQVMLYFQSVFLTNLVIAITFSAAFCTKFSSPDFIKLIYRCFHQRWFICQDACLKVSSLSAFHAYSCSGQVCRTDVGRFHVEYHQFEMNTWTKCHFHCRPQCRKLLMFFSEYRPRLLGMNQADC